MYSFNNVPFGERQQIYLHPPSGQVGRSSVQLRSIQDVDNNYKLLIQDYTSTQAIVRSEAKNKDSYWFWGPYSIDRWIYQNGQWLYDGLVNINETINNGSRYLV